MDFLADVWVTCPVCEGQRFNRETLQVRFKGKNIHDVLEMDVQEALEHFENVPKIAAMLQTLHDVGLDYLKLGQPSPTLSGGEAQRIKLARELCQAQHRARRSTSSTSRRPACTSTTSSKLLEVLHGFVEPGNTVVVIEHNLDVIKTADWVIDLGPEGGAGGGEVVAAGHARSRSPTVAESRTPARRCGGPRRAAAASVARRANGKAKKATAAKSSEDGLARDLPSRARGSTTSRTSTSRCRATR